MAPSQALLEEACKALGAADPALRRAHAETGLPRWRDRPVSFETIASIIAFQQISTRAAAAIWGRATSALGEVTPESIAGIPEDALRGLGLSRPKVAHLKSVAGAMLDGRLALGRVAAAPLVAARAELLAVKGIGPWTAEVFLLYARGEPDAFPVADVGLMEAYRQLSGAAARMDRAAFTRHAEGWRPWRGVAAHLLWGWLGTERAKPTSSA